MKYAIVGSRRRSDRESVLSFVNGLQPHDEVISGGCKGIDTWATNAASARGLTTTVYLPDLANCKAKWQVVRAHFARNEQIARACDVLVAFVADDRKGGTENTISHARRLNRPVIIL